MTGEISRRQLLWTVASCFFMVALDATIVNTALPTIARALGKEPLRLHLVIISYTLTMAMLTPASGWLADRFGMRRIYTLAILIFLIGSLSCAFAQTLPQLVIARVMQGVGGSMLLPIGRLAVLRCMPGEGYISAIAFVSVAGQLGPFLGPVLGGLLVEVGNWSWIFLINIPIGVLGLIAVYRNLPQDVDSHLPPFDFMGGTLLAVCMIAASLAVDTPLVGAKITWSASLSALAFITVILYLRHALYNKTPIFELRLFCEGNLGIGLASNLVCRSAVSAVPFLLPVLMQLELGYSPTRSGTMLVPVAIAGVISKFAIAPLVNHYGYRRFLFVNSTMVGLSIISLATFSSEWPLALQVAQLAVFGAVSSMQFAALNSITLKNLKGRDASSGNSLFSMMQMLSIGLGATFGSQLVDGFSWESHTNHKAFALTFISLGVVCLAPGLFMGRLALKK